MTSSRGPLAGLARVCTWPVAAATALGFLGGWWWVFDLASHFRPHYALAAALGLALAAAARAWRTAALGGATLLLNAALLLPFYAPGPAPGAGPRVSLLVLNVNLDYGSPPAVAELLARSDADVVGLVEVDEAWLVALAPALSRWPHRTAEARADRFGLAVYSRFPLRPLGPDHRGVEAPDGDAAFPVLALELELGGRRLPFFLVHPPPPVSAELTAVRDRTFAWLARHVPRDAVVAGDFNATPWSGAFWTLLSYLGGLHHGRLGFGLQASWPSMLGPLGIPIDHVLVSGDVAVTRHAVGPDVGSDHRPLHVEVTLP